MRRQSYNLNCLLYHIVWQLDLRHPEIGFKNSDVDQVSGELWTYLVFQLSFYVMKNTNYAIRMKILLQNQSYRWDLNYYP